MRKMLYSIYDEVVTPPVWWDNFLEEHSDDINGTLKLYGGTLEFENGHERWIVFERECDYTWFVLRWS